jgi:hypothetical protein
MFFLFTVRKDINEFFLKNQFKKYITSQNLNLKPSRRTVAKTV